MIDEHPYRVALGADYAAVLSRHFEIMRDALDAHQGVEVNTEGDSLFAAFTSAQAAVAAAAQMQLGLAATAWPRPVRVRMGLHSGEATLDGRDYVGGWT